MLSPATPASSSLSLDEFTTKGSDLDPSGRPLRRSLLQDAAKASQLPLLQLLLKHGASVNLKSPDDGYTALHVAAACAEGAEGLAAIQLLLQHGADREAKCNLGKRPIDLFLTSKLVMNNASAGMGASTWQSFLVSGGKGGANGARDR
jgi:ankyrin repeat protein